MNFGVIAQRLFPIPIDPKVRHVTYVEYGSNAALMLPPTARAANGQVFAFKKLIRQLSKFLKVDLIPQYPQPHKKPCQSLAKLGFATQAAGIPKRPIIPCQKETMEIVRSYLDNLTGKQSLDKPISIPYSTPIVPCPDIADLTPQQRYSAAARLGRRKTPMS